MSSTSERAGIRQKALQEELRELVDVVGPGPLVDLLLERAFQLQATDIHLDPGESGLRVRLRVDGLLHDVAKLPTEMTSHVISRVKLMANMDITERRLAQDGHIANAVLKQQRDIRVGSGPTIYGERLVLRLMPDASQLNRIEDLGFDEPQIAQIRRCISAPYGMILSVGPVGSGKSTTMYACLDVLNDKTKSLCTIEDPVERRVDGVNQIQVDSRIEFGFVEALRGVLRQDPNVMMVGEIRDPETAHIACRAGLTGVTVLSTLHANDAASTIDVFREFGIPPMFIADSLVGIISQRLLRKVARAAGRRTIRMPPRPSFSASNPIRRQRRSCCAAPVAITASTPATWVEPASSRSWLSTETSATPSSKASRTPKCSTSPNRRGWRHSKRQPRTKCSARSRRWKRCTGC